ncbi:putative integral membrane protein [Babesia bovis T2Bo]|uniref:Membrane protein, putative n=1 Tax=Babesia bovis TaxID=5865 RepID=A7AT46_BABBO|nr:putative integral membrane protein [Babesia bovis T2Bo]EDO06107.1 putative integral membrane protein [Babesia bovis T2Bo]BAN66009.1 membrane protein, putative [Babesia bovis]|eukprot:XP_001609675.1 membrane protein [Babesia bovis T2Bo]
MRFHYVVGSGTSLITAASVICGGMIPVSALNANSDDGNSVKENVTHVNTTFSSRLFHFMGNEHTTNPFGKSARREAVSEDSKSGDDNDIPKSSTDSDESNEDADIHNVFDKYRKLTYTASELADKIREILSAPDPQYGTDYNREWGRACLTADYEIPKTASHIHFDVFDPFLPPGLLFEDLGCLHLYNVANGYHLYKIRFGDMVITLLPDLEHVSMHLFEDSWGMMVVRVMFAYKGLLNRHEYTESSRGTREFRKTMGPVLQHAPPPINTKDLNKWLDEKYLLLSQQRPAIIEEVLTQQKN